MHNFLLMFTEEKLNRAIQRTSVPYHSLYVVKISKLYIHPFQNRGHKTQF